MRAFHLAAMAILCVTGSMSTACAQAHESRSGFGQDPPGPDERRRHIRELEEEIARLEGEMKRADNDKQRDELKKAIHDRRMRLEGLRGGDKRDPRGDLQERMARLERHIHELQRQLERKDLGPEDRKELSAKLEESHAQMDELRAEMKVRDRRDPDSKGGMERLHARLREIEDILAKGVGPEDRKQLQAERDKIQGELARRGMHHGPDHPGMPPDPELHKLHMEAMRLDRESMDLAAKLRMIPADKVEDRTQLLGMLKESVTKLFDMREKARAREIDLMKKRLDELTQMLEKRKENRDAIIEKRLKQLSGEADPLDW